MIRPRKVREIFIGLAWCVFIAWNGLLLLKMFLVPRLIGDALPAEEMIPREQIKGVLLSVGDDIGGDLFRFAVMLATLLVLRLLLDLWGAFLLAPVRRGDFPSTDGTRLLADRHHLPGDGAGEMHGVIS